MKHVAYRVFNITELQKEENWLNQMSSQGMLLSDVGFCRYVFIEDTPGAYTYRIQLLEHRPTHPQSHAYLRFLEESGVEFVGSVKKWVYLRKPTADGPFELFSDIPSKIKHLRSINRLGIAASAIFLGSGLTLAVFSILGYINSVNSAPVFIAKEAQILQFSITAVLYIAAALAFQFGMRPVRRCIRDLKKQSQIQE